MGAQSVVSSGASPWDRCRCTAVMVGYYLSAYDVGNGASGESRWRGLRRHLRISLARNDTVLSSSGLGFYHLLHDFRHTGSGQLVLGPSPPLRHIKTSRFGLKRGAGGCVCFAICINDRFVGLCCIDSIMFATPMPCEISPASDGSMQKQFCSSLYWSCHA